MQLHKHLLFTVACVLTLLPLSAKAADSVQGQVVDSNGTPLAGVAWKISGIEQLENGKWRRVHRSGLPYESSTDTNGRFTVLFRERLRYDLQFHKSGFAPAFVYEIGADANQLKVMLKRGESIHGTVTHLVEGNWKPLPGQTVELRLPSWDFWYQQRTLTDNNGKFEFRACAPPIEPSNPEGNRNLLGGAKDNDSQPKRKWQLTCAGKVVEIDVVDGKPVEPVNFKIETSADRHSP